MVKRRARKRKKGHGPGASKQARKQAIGKMSLGCLLLLLLGATWVILRNVLTDG